MSEIARVQRDIRQRRGFILWNLSFGHAVSHWYSESLLVLLPFVQTTMGFSNIQYGLLGTVQGLSSAIVNVPVGVMVDRMKRHWGPILAWCMVWTAISYVVLGVSPSYLFLLIAVVLITLPGTIWHLPATAALSQRFPDRRGFAVSIHGVGANAGNFIGPLVTGALLGVMFWRDIAFIYVAPALAVALVLWLSLRYIGDHGAEDEKKSLRVWLGDATRMVRRPMVIGLLAVALLRMGSSNVLIFWTPRYLRDPVESGGLGMEPVMVGLNFALLAGMGVVSGPILGLISDRFGRKVVLVPGLVAATLLPIALVNAGSGPLLTLTMVTMGFFTYSLQQIVLAAFLDIAGRGTEATAVGLLFGGGGMVTAVSPLIAAVIIDSFGLGSIFYYVAAVAGISAAVMLAIPLRKHESSPAPGS